MVPGLPRELAALRYGGTDLTPRQLELLRLLALGRTGPEAAREMGIGYETMRRHRAVACARLGARTTVQAVAIAVSLDLI